MKKAKKLIALCLAAVLALSLAACGQPAEEAKPAEEVKTTEAPAAQQLPKYADIKIGEDYTDLSVTISFFHNRTDMDKDGRMNAYIAEFNKLYPNVKVEQSSSTNYPEQTLLRLSTGGDWGDILYIKPQVLPVDYESYFMPWGTVEELSTEMKAADSRAYDGVVYGIPFLLSYQGMIYNKRVFQEAGVEEWPTTPEAFHEALIKVRDNTDAIPMYTNYADSWPVVRWNQYRSVATADAEFANNKIYTTDNPFADKGDGAGLYNLYKILWDAVYDGCTEDDYTTTDWEGAKVAINNGDIGCMLLACDYISQAAAMGDHAEDLAYGPLPITVNGQQYLDGFVDSVFGVNKNSSYERKLASMIFIKWMATQSTYCADTYSVPAANDGISAPAIKELDKYEVIFSVPTADDKVETYKQIRDMCNHDDLNFELIEAAAAHSGTFDELMDSWNKLWTDAQQSAGVEVQ